MAAVCVFCASSTRVPERYLLLAADVGAELARRGHLLVSGGGSVSCMGALARAARAGGARTVGVIPRGLVQLEVADRDAQLVVTPDMRSRKGEMERRADAFLALPGGLGTVEELVEIWVARTLRMTVKPLVVLDPDGAFGPLRAMVDRFVAEGFADAGALAAVRWATAVDQAFDLLALPSAVPPPPAEAALEAEP